MAALFKIARHDKPTEKKIVKAQTIDELISAAKIKLQLTEEKYKIYTDDFTDIDEDEILMELANAKATKGDQLILMIVPDGIHWNCNVLQQENSFASLTVLGFDPPVNAPSSDVDRILAITRVIQSRKCCICGYNLSVAPIVTAGPENELYRCGRCSEIEYQENASSHRVLLYEDVVRLLTLPCSYLLCNKKIPWGLVENHEKSCPHRTVRCPVYYQDCSQVVRLDRLGAHFRLRHKGNIKTLTDSLDISKKFIYVYLIQVENQHFFFYKIKQGRVAVLAIEHSKYTKFSVSVSMPDKDNFAVSFDDLDIVRYDERSQCFACVDNECELPHHLYSKKNKAGKIDLDRFSHKLTNDLFSGIDTYEGKLRYHLQFKADPNFVADTQTQPEENTPTNDQNSPANVLRNALCCPCCMAYMESPIYICTVGHSYCRECKPRLEKCPMCREPLGEARNYALEEILADIKISCQYDSKGCTRAGDVSTMKVHELECPSRNLHLDG